MKKGTELFLLKSITNRQAFSQSEGVHNDDGNRWRDPRFATAVITALAGAILFSATGVSSAAPLQSAPLNPEFADYQQKLKAGVLTLVPQEGENRFGIVPNPGRAAQFSVVL